MISVRVVLLSLVIFASFFASTVVAAAQDAGGWIQLLSPDTGPTRPQPVTSIAVAPGWPGDGVMLAVRDTRLVRTQDGGATWEDIGAAPAETVWFTTFGGTRLVLANGKTGIHRSMDDGTSWQPVLPLTTEYTPSLQLSPQFSQDGRGIAEADDRIYTTVDGAATWTEVTLAPDQGVRWSGIWTDAGPDRDFYAVIERKQNDSSSELHRGGDGGWELVEPAKDRLVDRPIFATGGRVVLLLRVTQDPGAPRALVSSDGGSTWAPLATGLAVGDQPQRLDASALTPYVTDDGAIFVTTVGAETYKPTLFRGDALGATWTHLSAAPVASTQYQRADRSLSVSPQFTTDNTLLLTQNTSQGSPSSGLCEIHRSADRGETWAEVYSERRGSCSVFRVLGPAGVHWFLTVSNPGGLFRSESTDGGQTWRSLSPGSPTVGSVSTIVPSPNFDQHGTVFVGTRGGAILARGQGLQATNAQATCGSEPVGGFGRLWSTGPNMRQTLGCPSGPETPLQIRVRQDGNTRGLWPEDGGDIWYTLDLSDRSYSRKTQASLDTFWANGPDGVVPGALQEFNGGTMLFLDENGKRTILVLEEQGKFSEFPD